MARGNKSAARAGGHWPGVMLRLELAIDDLQHRGLAKECLCEMTLAVGSTREFTMLSILLTLALTGAEPGSPQPDLTAAKSWVSLVDAKRWNDSWASAGVLFKSRMAQPTWTSTIEPVRVPLGAVSTRTLKSVTKSTSLPGVPDGEYEVVQFATSFANKAAATETVVLAHEASGWKVDGYFIR